MKNEGIIVLSLCDKLKIVPKRKFKKIFSNFCDFALDKLKIVCYNNNRRQHEAHMIINCAV